MRRSEGESQVCSSDEGESEKEGREGGREESLDVRAVVDSPLAALLAEDAVDLVAIVAVAAAMELVAAAGALVGYERDVVRGAVVLAQRVLLCRVEVAGLRCRSAGIGHVVRVGAYEEDEDEDEEGERREGRGDGER